MKKLISIIVAIMTVFTCCVVTAQAAQTLNVTVSGYDVTGEIKAYYLDDDGNVVEKENATQLILKNNGAFICNGVLVEVGNNGKASLLMKLPVDYVITEGTVTQSEQGVAEEVAEETNNDLFVSDETFATDATEEINIETERWHCHCPFWVGIAKFFVKVFKTIFSCGSSCC